MPTASNVRQLSDVVGSDWAFVRVDWSHDGTKIVGQAGATDNIAEWDIWVINADGSGATNVGAHAGGDEIIPSWAPDRDALAWEGDGIVLLEEGADPVDLPGPDGVPCGRPMDSSSLDHGAGIVVMDLDGNVQMTVAGPASDVSLATRCSTSRDCATERVAYGTLSVGFCAPRRGRRSSGARALSRG